MTTTIDASAAPVNLVLVQGDDWVQQFRLGSRPSPDSDIEYWDLTGWSGKSQMRRKATSEEVLAELDVEIGEDQDNPDLAGFLVVSLSAEDAADLPSSCVWDLELTNPDLFKKTYMAGSVVVNREVTKDS